MIHSLSTLRESYQPREIIRLTEGGRLLRAGPWYAEPTTKQAVVAALRAGARPTCVTAADHHGLWVPPVTGTHVISRRGAAVPTGFVTHGWHSAWPEPSPVASVPILLEHAVRCLDPLDVGILVDSALHQRLVRECDVAALITGAPRAVRAVLARTTALAESGTESKVRLFLQLRGVTVTPQAQIDGVGRVDLLVGNRWIIEADSRAHHTGEAEYASDRRRDRDALERGYLTSRLTHQDVFGGWEATMRWILSVLRTGQHLHRPSRWQGRPARR